jgi:hypothetical protein
MIMGFFDLFKKRRIDPSDDDEFNTYMCCLAKDTVSTFNDKEEYFSQIKKWNDKMYQISSESKRLIDNDEIAKAKSLLENAVFVLISDTVSHYFSLYLIYKQENNLKELERLKKSVDDEIPKSRNKKNGSDKKFARLSNNIEFELNLKSLVLEIPSHIINKQGINKRQMLELIAEKYNIDQEKANTVYDTALKNNIIVRRKKGNRYQHFIY